MNTYVNRGHCPICRQPADVMIDEWVRDGVRLHGDEFTDCCGATPVYCGEEIEFVGVTKLIQKSNRNRLDAEAFGPAQEG